MLHSFVNRFNVAADKGRALFMYILDITLKTAG